jgi:hypothetical protein
MALETPKKLLSTPKMRKFFLETSHDEYKNCIFA